MQTSAPEKLERGARQVVLPRGWYLSRTEVMARYGVSAQRVNGWRSRRVRPLPAAIMVAGDPYWHIQHLVTWERRRRWSAPQYASSTDQGERTRLCGLRSR